MEGLSSSSPDSTTAEALAELSRCRNLLDTTLSHEGSQRVTAVVADELAYDIALIDLAKHLGVGWDVRDFDNPSRGRSRLEHELTSMGIRLGT